MDIDEIVKGIEDHNASYPNHPITCSCLDEYAVALHTRIEQQETPKLKKQLREVFRLALLWDDMRRRL